MNRTRVSSRMINSIGYDNKSNILEIKFKAFSIYQYFSVPERIYSEFLKASSHGKYFLRYIRGKYKYRRIK